MAIVPAGTAIDQGTDRRKPEACTVIIFGAAGDLSYRKLMPSLFHLVRGDHLPEKMIFIGVDRLDITEEAFRKEVAKGHARAPGLQTMMLPRTRDWDEFTKHVYYFKGDITSEKSMQEFAAYVNDLEARYETGKNRLLYLSVPPPIFDKGLKALEQAGLVGKATRKKGQWSRVIVEKPFGRDLESACKLNTITKEILAENETYRIDHYLGKETVQNVLFLRFANAIYEPLWNHKYIDHVQITAAEPLGLEKRAGYYEETGALRDMIQNHIMQVMALIAMEPPVSFDAEPIRDEKVKALKALRPIEHKDVLTETVRGQYGPGRIGRNEVPGYRQEEGANPNSMTETFCAVRAYIDNWRWGGTPFYLRTGKRMAKPDTEVTIVFKQPPHVMFTTLVTPPKPNMLVLQVQPNDGITLNFEAKVPGSDAKVKTVNMHFRYPEAFVAENPSAYERLLMDCMLGDQTLFIRSDEVEAAWRFVTPIHQGWAEADKEKPPAFPNYKAGTWGPEQADEWLRKDNREWHNI
jgi:glucose-6-phosphate 1-dehydrogenase